jgi:hypothetical protein
MRPRLGRFGRPIRDALIIVGIARAIVYFVVQDIRPWDFPGVDARAYWGIDLAHPYAESGVGVVSTYLYSPPFAQIMAPFSLLPFPVFFALWTALNLAILVWLVRPWPWAVPMLILPITYELLVGNVHFLITAAIVVALGRPAAWVLPILTKITPGIGGLWHAIRGDWRGVIEIGGLVLAIVVVSYLVNPTAWVDWIALLTTNAERGELLIPRVVIGAVMVVIGALTGRRWLVPVAVWLALPVVWINAWVVLLATIRLRHPVPAPHGSQVAAR